MIETVRSGKLKDRLVLQRAVETTDELGDVTRTWPERARRWGSIEPLRGQELFDAQKVKSNVTHRIEVRDDAGATSSDRWVHNGRAFNILHIINPEERGVFYQHLCKEETQP